MPLIPFPVDQFGGLNVAVDPTDVGTSGAVDLLNVDLDRPGTLRTRDGTARLQSGTQPARGIGAFATTGGIRHLVVTRGSGSGGNMTAYDTSGTQIGNVAVNTPLGFAEARWGDSTHEYLFVSTGTLPQKWDGAAFSTAAIPFASYMTVKPDSNRLVVGKLNGGGVSTAGTGKSRVAFSNPGAPETWTYAAGPPETGNFVDLAPGDGSQITGLATWAGQVFAFKERRFFVFGLESTESDGTPIFNYRPVEGFGSVVPVAAGDEGVYFCDGRTVWVTTGGAPTRISAPIERFLRKQTTIAGSTYSTSTGGPKLAYSQGRLYLTLATTGTHSWLTFIYDARGGFWTVMLWIGTAAQEAGTYDACTLDDTTGVAATYAQMTNGDIVRLNDPANTDDAGTAIPWSYQTGYSSAGGYFRQRIISSGERKRHHHVDILGSGTVTHQVLTLNPRVADIADPGGSVTLGTAPAIARGKRRRGARGTHIAHKLSGSGPATISGLTYWLTNVGSDT